MAKKFSITILCFMLTFGLIMFGLTPQLANASTTKSMSAKIKVISIKPINITVNQGQNVVLPKTVSAKTSNGTVNLAVIWRTGKVNTSKVGVIKINGTVKDYNKSVELKINVQRYVLSVENISISINHNEKYEMPKTVKVRMSDGSEENKKVIWDSNLDTSVVGISAIEGVVDGIKSKVLLEATVNSYLKTVNNIEVTVMQEDFYEFPWMIEGIMSDNKEVDVLVTWSSQRLDTTKVGINTYVGTVEGYAEKVYLTINVKSDKMTVKEISAFKNSIVSIRTYDRHGNFDGSGSGFVISEDGIIVTCYHVLDESQSCLVVFEDGTKYEIEGIFGYNKDRDIAIIKLKDAHKIPYIELGNSDKVEIGDEIVAIGNPLGFVNSVSSGTVSGLNRKIDEKQGNIIQFTAGVTFGSSGGALFNMKGEVVGMTNAIMNTTGNLNFAIPCNEIQTYLSVTEKKTMAELNPLNDDQKYEFELEKKFSGSQFNGITINPSSIYIQKEEDGIVVYTYYDDDNYDSFNKNIYKSGINSNVRLAYEAYAKNIYNEVKSHYKTQEITIVIKGYQGFDVKPNESDFDKVSYDANMEFWTASTTFAIYGDDDDGYAFQWRAIK